MDTEIKRKWVEALRSGEYMQAQGKLRRSDGYCCLGVLCDVTGIELDEYGTPENQKWDGFYESLMGEHIGREQRDVLMDMNDGGAPFTEIADYIEANL